MTGLQYAFSFLLLLGVAGNLNALVYNGTVYIKEHSQQSKESVDFMENFILLVCSMSGEMIYSDAGFSCCFQRIQPERRENDIFVNTTKKHHIFKLKSDKISVASCCF